MSKAYYVYMLAGRRYGTLYLGVTSDLPNRVWQHKEGLAEGYEKQIKKWNRAWKIKLFQEKNPRWHGLYDEIV